MKNVKIISSSTIAKTQGARVWLIWVRAVVKGAVFYQFKLGWSLKIIEFWSGTGETKIVLGNNSML